MEQTLKKMQYKCQGPVLVLNAPAGLERKNRLGL